MNKPTIKEIAEYCNNQQEAVLFFHHFESNGWKVGKNPMKSWKSAITGWLTRNKKCEIKSQSKVEQSLSNTSTKLTDRLWKRFTEIYGHKWVSSYGPEPTKPWIDVIEKLPPDSIKYGLNQILKHGEDWPPSLTKFHSLCTGNRSRVPTVNALPHKAIEKQREATQQIKTSSLSKIRAML